MRNFSKMVLFCFLSVFLYANGLVAKDSVKIQLRFLSTIEDSDISIVKAECTLKRGGRFLKELATDVVFGESCEFNFNLSNLFDLIKGSNEDPELEVTLVTREHGDVTYAIENLSSYDFGNFILSKLPEWYFVLTKKNGYLALGKILEG